MTKLLPALLLLAALTAQAKPPAWAEPTFESLGLYYNQTSPGRSCTVRYRAAGSPQWRDGYPLVYDRREQQWRGSLVGLTADTGAVDSAT